MIASIYVGVTLSTCQWLGTFDNSPFPTNVYHRTVALTLPAVDDGILVRPVSPATKGRSGQSASVVVPFATYCGSCEGK